MSVSLHPRAVDTHHGMTSPSFYLTRAEAARYLNLPARWLANNARSGPSYIKVGGLVRYSIAALDAYMFAHERPR